MNTDKQEDWKETAKAAIQYCLAHNKYDFPYAQTEDKKGVLNIKLVHPENAATAIINWISQNKELICKEELESKDFEIFALKSGNRKYKS